MSARIEGIDALVRDLTFAAAKVRPEAGKVVVDQAERAAQKMRDRVPIDSGMTLESVTADNHPTVAGNGVSAEAGPEWFVGKFLEEGTAKMGPQPFAEPAMTDQLPEFVRAMNDLHNALWR